VSDKISPYEIRKKKSRLSAFAESHVSSRGNFVVFATRAPPPVAACGRILALETKEKKRERGDREEPDQAASPRSNENCASTR